MIKSVVLSKNSAIAWTFRLSDQCLTRVVHTCSHVVLLFPANHCPANSSDSPFLAANLRIYAMQSYSALPVGLVHRSIGYIQLLTVRIASLLPLEDRSLSNTARSASKWRIQAAKLAGIVRWGFLLQGRGRCTSRACILRARAASSVSVCHGRVHWSEPKT